MESNGGDLSSGWSDRVEDLVDGGHVDGAVALLESVVSSLEARGSSSSSSDDLRLAAALGGLADLHASRGFSLRADELRSRALLVRTRSCAPASWDSRPSEESALVKEAPGREGGEIVASHSHKGDNDDTDDWEAMADRVVSGEGLFSSQQERAGPSLSRGDPPNKATPKRRGRGSFMYQKTSLYSDQPDIEITDNNNSVPEDEVEIQSSHAEVDDSKVSNLTYGTGHVLVLYDFPPATRTTDLEKLFDSFRDSGFSIRWVNDTTALAVFRTPSIANEARNSVCCPFRVRQLVEGDAILTEISRRGLLSDLEPPVPRPKTSARTAQRLIAQGMGVKFNTDFGSKELRKQEDARRNRILARQTMKDDAWGSD